MNKKTYSTVIADKTIMAEFNDLANQADGSVIISSGDTVVLVTAVMSKSENSGAGWFPLSVEFEEKFYAAGQILGSRFIRREGRPSEEAILSARVIDRTIRPLFNQAIRSEIQIVATVLAIGDDDPDVLGIIGASLALAVSDIPWQGPIGAVRIGRDRQTGAVLVNPNYSARSENKLDFEVLACGKDGGINMIETVADEVSESDMVSVLEAATKAHKVLEDWQEQIVSEIGKEKRPEPVVDLPSSLTELFTTKFKQKLETVLFSGRAGKDHIYELKDAFVEKALEGNEDLSKSQVGDYFEEEINKELHRGAIEESKRADGRALDEVRSLYAQAGGVSDRLHGSGVFYRGGTHIFTALTLGGPEAAQLIDTIENQDTKKSYFHHYNFPPFSVGDTGRVGGFNRRMIGHGSLAEKAVLPMLPSKEEFPYTIRLVSETMASNGSSSMGSVCGSTLALMDGGVPLKRPIAGIASGVMISGDKYALLTDIQGPEDEHGDMDFKVAGTKEGITAMQMDVKSPAIPIAILAEALTKAKQARLEILAVMEAEIDSSRSDISPYAPKIITIKIDPEQIGLVIGPGGKTINAIKDESGVEEISIEDDGTIYISGRGEVATIAKDKVLEITKVFVVGERLDATITKLTDFGAFAKLNDQTEGLIHISEISTERIEKVDDVLAVGDTVPVMVSKVENGKIGLSIKQANPDFVKRSVN